jgi:oxidase EvaA
LKASRSGSFIESALAEKSRFGTADDLEAWLAERTRASRFEVFPIEFAALDQWTFEPDGALAHRSGRFFRVEGIEVETNFPYPRRIVQPIIHQPEIGILGFLVKEFDGVLHFLIQAKMEPGNVNLVQISPTVQATKSNYSQVHQGKRPRYIEYFIDRKNGRVLVDQLQSEQGAFFLRKRNRNMIVHIEGDVALHDDFRWATLGQMNTLLRENNLINMDSRTVLSCIPFFEGRHEIPGPSDISQHSFRQEVLDSLFGRGRPMHDTAELISWFTELKTQCEIAARAHPLGRLSGWSRSAEAISRDDRRYFSVIAISVLASNREVSGWTQPIIAPCEKGIAGFLAKRFNGTLHFLTQARLEAGSFDMLEMAPTVQHLPGDGGVGAEEKPPPFLEQIAEAPARKIRHDSLQSEEGGRFYHYQNRNIVVQLDDDETIDIPPHYAWMSLHQIKELIRYNQFNIEARGLLACLGLAA